MPVRLLVIALVFALTAAGAVAQVGPAVPTPTAAPDTLPVIGRTRSKRYCTVETDRTNGAITVALVNDKIISSGIGRLRAANLDRFALTVIEREKTMHDLRAVAAAISTNVRAGEAQVADLRTLSVHEPDPTRSPALKAFADQMDDTLGTQRTIGVDLAKMLTIIEGRHAATQGSTEAAAIMPQTNADHVENGLPSIDERAASEPLDALFRDVADEFTQRAAAIGKSEDAAAVHAPKAVAGC